MSGQVVVDETVRKTCDEDTGKMHYDKAVGGYTAAPTSLLDEVQLLCLLTTKALTLRLDGQSDAGVVVNANGLVLLVDVDIDAGSTTNVTHENAGAETATVDLFAAGT